MRAVDTFCGVFCVEPCDLADSSLGGRTVSVQTGAVVVESMGAMFPELNKNPQRVVELVKDEEVWFGKIVGSWDSILVKRINRSLPNLRPIRTKRDGHVTNPRKVVISGQALSSFTTLMDSPIDLTRIMASEERAIAVDVAG